jgi:hypothetical protein
MISITSYWACVTFTMAFSVGLLIYAYLTGEAGASTGLGAGLQGKGQSGSSVSRLLKVCRKNEATWRLPGIRLQPRYRRIGMVAVACQADYSCRFGEARSRIPR